MGHGDLDDMDEDMLDAALLASFDWSPSSLSDIDEMPERVLWLYVSYRNGQQAKIKKG
jgi:hypothetical protein